MNIQAEKLEIVKMILETDNPSILDSIKKIFKKGSGKDFWESLPEREKKDILQGINDADEGKVVDYEAFMKKHR